MPANDLIVAHQLYRPVRPERTSRTWNATTDIWRFKIGKSMFAATAGTYESRSEHNSLAVPTGLHQYVNPSHLRSGAEVNPRFIWATVFLAISNLTFATLPRSPQQVELAVDQRRRQRSCRRCSSGSR